MESNRLTALKTTSLRLRGTSVDILNEEGLDSEGAVTSKSKLQSKVKALSGVDILTATGEYKSTYEILSQIADVWEDINDMDQAALLELISGKRNSSVIAAILQNPTELKEAFEDAQNAEGSALRENEKYLDSIQGRIDLFTNAVQTMWQNMLNSDVVKFFVNLGTHIIEFVDSFGLIPTALTGLFVYFTAIKKNNPITLIKDWGNSMVNAGLKTNQATTSLANLTVQQQAAKMATQGLTQEEIKNNLIKNNNISTDRAQLLAEEAVTNAKIKQTNVTAAGVLADWAENKVTLSSTAVDWLEKQSTDALTKAKLQQALQDKILIKQEYLEIAAKYGLLTATDALKLGVQGLTATIKASMASNPIGWILLIIGAVVSLITWLANLESKTERLTKKLEDLKSGLSDVQSQLESVNSELETTQDRMAELLAMDHLSFAEKEELENLRKQNDELQRKLDLLENEKRLKQTEIAKGFVDVMEQSVNKDTYNKAGKRGFWAKLGGIFATAKGQAVDKWNATEYADYLMQQYQNELKKQENQQGKKVKKWEKAKPEKYSEAMSALLKEWVDNADQLEYGINDDTDKWLDYVYNLQDKWAVTSGGANAKTNAISRIFNKDQNAAIKESIDKWVEELNKGNQSAKAEIDKIIRNNADLVADLKASGIEINDTVNEAAEYFASFASEANYATIDGKIKEMDEAVKRFNGALGDIDTSSVDAVKQALSTKGWIDENGEPLSDAIAEYFGGEDGGISEKTRKEIERLVKQIYDGKITVQDALKSFELFGVQSVIDIQVAEVKTNFKDVFVDLEDADGLIDTFKELGDAIGSTVGALEAFNQAQADVADKGFVSIQTALQLMEYTDDYGSILEVVDGKLQLTASAEQNLIQARIDAIKVSAQTAVADAQAAYDKAELAVQSYRSAMVEEASASVVATAWQKIVGVAAGIKNVLDNIWSGESIGDLYSSGYESYLTSVTGEMKYDDVGLQALEDALSYADNKLKEAEGNAEIANALTADGLEDLYNPSDKSTLEEVAKSKWDELINKYENELALITNERDLIEAEIDKAEARGGKASAQYYRDLIENSNDEKELLEEKKRALEAYLAANEGNIDPETWTEYNNEINETAVAIKECETNTIEWAEAIREIDTHYFEQTTEAISQLGEELDFVNGLLEDEEVADENGNWSNAALTRMGLYTQQMEKAAAEAQLYQGQIDELNEQYNKGEIGEEEYQESLADLVSGQRDAIQSYEDAKDGIVELNEARIDAIKEGIEKEIEAYEDYIDVVKEALDAERDLHDFKKSTAEKTKNIAALERRIASLSGSTNASDVAERKKLQAELMDAKSDLDDHYYDHAKDQQSQALDDEAEAFSQSKEKYIEELEATLEDVETLITNSIMEVMLNADTVLAQLNEISDKYGITLSTELTQPWVDAAAKPAEYWQSAEDAISQYADFLTSEELGSQFKNTITGFGEQIQSLVTYWHNVRDAANDAYDAQNRKTTVGGDFNLTDNTGGDDNKNRVYNPDDGCSMSSLDVKNLQEILNTVFGEDLTIDGDYGPATTAAVKKAQGMMSISQDGYYGPATESAMRTYIQNRWQANNNGSSMLAMLPKSYYAKGTLGTSRDQWALTDEIGDELVLIPGANGNLSFMRKGTSVVPADITANLVEWGKLNPNMFNVGGGANINMISNAVTKPELNFEFDSLVHVDNCSQETLKDLEKMVDNKINQFTKRLNYSLKGIGAK